MRTRTVFTVLAIFGLALATSGGGAVGSRDIEASERNESWELKLRAPGDVRAHEMTAVELSLKNVSSETRRADIDCVSWFGLIVFNEGGEQVFDWYDYVIETEFGDQIPECDPFSKDLAPGETLDQTVSFVVDEPGGYTVRPQPPSETVGSTSQPVLLSLSVKVRAK